jgi:hypothetical protein
VEGGSLDFRSGAISERGDWFHKRKAPVLKLGALRWIPMRHVKSPVGEA